MVEEIKAEITRVVPHNSPIQFDIEFLPNEEVVLKAMTRALDPLSLEQSLKEYKPSLATAIAGKALGSLQLCHTDTSLNVTRRESDSTVGDGWSRVAAKGAAPRKLNPQTTLAGRNAFSSLGGDTGKVTFSAKKKITTKKPVKVEEPVVDDWEAAEIAEEEKEKIESGASSAGEEEYVIVDEPTKDGSSKHEPTRDEPTHDEPEASAIVGEANTSQDAVA